MDRIKLILLFLLLGLLLLAGVYMYGRQQGKRAAEPAAPTPVVSTQLILDRITEEYFLVTKTVYMDSKAQIATPKREDWTDLIIGNTITVRGLVRVDVGVDLKGLGAKDIVLDAGQKTVTLTLPPAAILDSSLFGELDVEVDKAILDKLKGLFQDTASEDYNRALKTLLATATDRVSADGRIFNQARADSIKLVELIVTGLLKDHRVIVQ